MSEMTASASPRKISGAPHPAAAVVGGLLVLAGIGLVLSVGTSDRTHLWLLGGATGMVAALVVLVGALVGSGSAGRYRMAPVLFVLPIFFRAALKSGALQELWPRVRRQSRPWIGIALIALPGLVFALKPVYAPIEITPYHADVADDPMGDMPPGLRAMLEQGPPPGEEMPADAPPELRALLGAAQAAPPEPETYGYFSETHLYFTIPGIFFLVLALLMLVMPAGRREGAITSPAG